MLFLWASILGDAPSDSIYNLVMGIGGWICTVHIDVNTAHLITFLCILFVLTMEGQDPVENQNTVF